MDNRSIEEIRSHYEIEKELAKKLLDAPWPERSHLASTYYDELYRRVPEHPQLTKKNSTIAAESAVNTQMKFLKPYLKNCKVFLEVGPGDCALSIQVSNLVEQVYGVDVSSEITKLKVKPINFQLLLSDGRSIPLNKNTVNIAYSNQLMEHLHPDDAIDQLKNIYSVLVEGGKYICITPNNLTGPHDISMHFDDVATGFHLKEYSILELSQLFKGVGFSEVKASIGLLGVYLPVPINFLVAIEKLVSYLPNYLRKHVARTIPFRVFLDMIRVLGIK